MLKNEVVFQKIKEILQINTSDKKYNCSMNWQVDRLVMGSEKDAGVGKFLSLPAEAASVLL